MSKRSKAQSQWNDLGLDDLRTLSSEFRLDCPSEVTASASIEHTFEVLLNAFGLNHQDDKNQITTPIGLVDVHGRKLKHIIEKRSDARERFIHYALSTISNPFEIWSSEYIDQTKRFQFIGTFNTRNQMLVIVAQYETHTLWNFMHTEAKKLNKHRCGELVYQRKKATL